MKERWLYYIREANMNIDNDLYAVLMFAEAMKIVAMLTGVNPAQQYRRWNRDVQIQLTEFGSE